MRHDTTASREPRRSRASHAEASAGERAATLSPPGYGIDFVDRGGGSPLPVQLRAGVESLSGFDLSGVRVHSASALPARLGALAYTRGAEIHLGPGQERHLPHEAWHVVQQAQNRVTPTLQAKGGVGINDDARLEREADEMGTRAMATRAPAPRADAPRDLPARGGGVVQRVRGGVEFTEDGPAELYSFLPPAAPGGGGPVLRDDRWTVDNSPVSVFTVPDENALGNQRNTDHTLLTSREVKLTNDVVSAEWVITRHGADVTPAVMKRNLTADIEQMFDMRRDLANKVRSHDSANPGELTALVPGNVQRLHRAPQDPGVFVYKPGDSKGKAQVTAQYSNVDTIRRINLLNASKFLGGTKVAVGEDVDRVGGTQSDALTRADVAGTTSFSSAGALLTELTLGSNPIREAVTNNLILTAPQVALVKLMVMNDALATTMVRYAANVGQAQEKNLQRFFPKSRRDEYVKAVAGAAVTPENMLLLRAEIHRTADADALLLYQAADPGALRTDEAFAELSDAEDADPTLAVRSPTLIEAKQIENDPALKAREAARDAGFAARHALNLIELKDAVLGVNGGLLSAWIQVASLAYTDTSLNRAEHRRDVGGGQMLDNVIKTSAGFTPVVPGTIGAIYEFRERETAAEEPRWYKIGSISELKTVIEKLFVASE